MTQPTIALSHSGSRMENNSQNRNSWLKGKLANRRSRGPTTTLAGVDWKPDVKDATFSGLDHSVTTGLMKNNNNNKNMVTSTTSLRIQTNITSSASSKHWPLPSITAIWPRSAQRSISHSRTPSRPSTPSTPRTATSSTFSLPFRGRRRAHSVSSQPASQPATPETTLATPKSFRHSSYFPVTTPLSREQSNTNIKSTAVAVAATAPSAIPANVTSTVITKSSSLTCLPSSSTNHEEGEEVGEEESCEANSMELTSEGNETETINLEQFPTLTDKEMKALTSDQRSMKKRFPEFADEVHLLIDSFACVLQKDAPWHGRLYICCDMACFYGVLFRRRIREVFPLGEIQGVEKELRFKVFPSAIRITMSNGQECTLRSFIKRDAAWEVLTNAWQAYKRALNLPALCQRKHRQSITSILTRSSDDSVHNCDTNRIITEMPQIQRNGKEDIMSDSDLSNNAHRSLNRSQSDVQHTTMTSDANNGASLLERRSQSLKRNCHRQVDSSPRHKTRNLKLACDILDFNGKSERSNAIVSAMISGGQTEATTSNTITTGFVTPSVSPDLIDTSSDTLSIEQQDTSHFCGCNDHGKYQLLNMQLAIKPKTAFRALFGESGHAIRPSDRDQRWNRDGNGNWTQRDIAYTSFFRPLCVPKKLPATYEHQRVRVSDHKKGVYKVDTWTRFTAMTAADRIVVYVRWCLTGVPVDGNDTLEHTRVVATAFVEFTRKILIREGAAERTAIERMQSRVQELAGMLSAYVNQLPTLHSIGTFTRGQSKAATTATNTTTSKSVLGTTKTVGFNDIVTEIDNETDRVHASSSKNQSNTRSTITPITSNTSDLWSLKGLLNGLANNMAIGLLVLIIFITTYHVTMVLRHDSRSIPAVETTSINDNESSASITPQSGEDVFVKWQQHRYAEDSLENLNQLHYRIDRLGETITQTRYNSHLTRDIIWSTVIGQLARILQEDIRMRPNEKTTTMIGLDSSSNDNTSGSSTEQRQQQMFERPDSFSTEFLQAMEHLIMAATTATTSDSGGQGPPQQVGCICDKM